VNPGDPEKGERSSLSGYWLGPPLIRAPSVLPFFCAPRDARASAPLRPAPGASEDGAAHQPSLHLPSTCPPLSPRALTRARCGGAALGLSSRASSCPRSTDRWRGARARAVQVRRRRRRRSALRGATGAECDASACGLTPTEEAAAAAAAAMEATTCARHRRHATVSSASLRSPRGRRAIGRVGARRFDAAGVSNAAPTGTVARKRRRIARAMWETASENNRGRRRWRHCLHAPRPAI
jgi:hypothetical protein